MGGLAYMFWGPSFLAQFSLLVFLATTFLKAAACGAREREGGWVGGWLNELKIEENKAVRMSYCELGVGWVGGWVG